MASNSFSDTMVPNLSSTNKLQTSLLTVHRIKTVSEVSTYSQHLRRFMTINSYDDIYHILWIAGPMFGSTSLHHFNSFTMFIFPLIDSRLIKAMLSLSYPCHIGMNSNKKPTPITASMWPKACIGCMLFWLVMLCRGGLIAVGLYLSGIQSSRQCSPFSHIRPTKVAHEIVITVMDYQLLDLPSHVEKHSTLIELHQWFTHV